MKTVHVATLIAMYSGKLACELEVVHKALEYMVDDDLFTHQLPRINREVSPYLRHSFPWLDTVDYTGFGRETWQDFPPVWEELYGAWHEITPIPRDDHDVVDPRDEPNIQHKEIIDIELGDDEPNPCGDINW